MESGRKDTGSIIVGSLLVLGGIVFLLGSFGIINAGALLISLMFGVGGLAFLGVFLTDIHRNWWALIPGFALAGLGSMIGISALVPALGELFGAAMLFGGLAVAFLLIYVLDTERWWAVIPGGVMLTLAGVTVLSSTNLPYAGQLSGSLLFFGLACTFGVLYFLPTPQGRLSWAIFPALGCAAFGVVVFLSLGGVVNFLWPIFLIAGGLFLIYRNSQRSAL